MKSNSSLKMSKPINAGNANVRIGIARFTFKNGDSYEGKYQVNIERCILVKQGQGIYITDNFDTYNGKWYNDEFNNVEFHIRYNNNAQYKGNVDPNGAMNDIGTYIFPDGSSLTSTWSQNKPISNIVYKEPLGYEWTPLSISDNQILFTTDNHFWNEIYKEFSQESFLPVSH